MAEVTLEELAKRVEALERVTGLQGLRTSVVVIPGKGDWDEFLRAATELSRTFDFDAIDDQNQYEIDIADMERLYDSR